MILESDGQTNNYGNRDEGEPLKVKQTENPYQMSGKKLSDQPKKEGNKDSFPELVPKKNNLIGGDLEMRGQQPRTVQHSGFDDALDGGDDHRHDDERRDQPGHLSSQNSLSNSQAQRSGKVPLRKTFKPEIEKNADDFEQM